MKKLLLALTFLFSIPLFAANQGDDILGVWWSPDQKTKVQITNTEGKYFGKIVAVRKESSDKKDVKNLDKSMQSRKILGLQILRDFNFSGSTWKDGKIYDPENGRTYSSTMWIDKDVLKIRGYVGISLLGRTVEFKKVSGNRPLTQQKGEPARVHLKK